MLAANPSFPGRCLPLLPYKLLHAQLLAEAGLISEATRYATSVAGALAAAGKLPPGLLVCRAVAGELISRLETHAAVSLV